MKVVHTRLASLLAVAAVTVAAACSDAGTTNPLSAPNTTQGGRGATSGDTALTGNPGQPGNAGDTAKTGNPADSSGNPAKPVASFTLDVKTLGGSLTGPDTLLNGPIGGVRIDVYAQTYTFTGGGGADSVQINETLVTTGVTDGTGHVVFPNLKGGGQVYQLRGTPPEGSGYRGFKGFVPIAYSDKLSMTFVLQKQ